VPCPPRLRPRQSRLPRTCASPPEGSNTSAARSRTPKLPGRDDTGGRTLRRRGETEAGGRGGRFFDQGFSATLPRDGQARPEARRQTAGWVSAKNSLKETTPSDPPAEDCSSDLDPASILELRRLAHSRPRSGRGAAAKASAIRTLERLGRERRKQAVPRCRRAGIRTSPATRTTSSIGCSCTSTRTSCSGIGRGRGARGECESALFFYSRSPRVQGLPCRPRRLSNRDGPRQSPGSPWKPTHNCSRRHPSCCAAP
jgi:hypothetical protein